MRQAVANGRQAAAKAAAVARVAGSYNESDRVAAPAPRRFRRENAMRTLCRWTMAALLVAAAWPAAANPWRHGGPMMQVQRPQQDRFQRPPPPQRDFRSAPPAPDRGGGRMTDQERRDLHRDLDRANRELYKGRR